MVLPAIRVPIEADATGAIREIDRTGDAIANLGNRAPAATRATGGLTNRLRGLGNVSNQTRARIQNTSFQLQDLIVQLQGGTRASTAFAQQLPQLLGGFGALGAVLGVVAGIGIPAAAAAFSSLGGESRDLEEQLEDLEDRVKNYAEASRRANLNTGELAKQFRELTPEITQAARALAEVARREAQDEIDALTTSLSELFDVGGAGDQRVRIADFFDVGIVLAFTDAQRESRKEARRLTAEFLNAQRALQSAEGDVNAQFRALSRLLRVTQDLSKATDDVSTEENKLIGRIARAVEQAGLHRDAVAEAESETISLGEAIQSAQSIASTLVTTTENLADPITDAATAAADLAKNLFESARARAVAIASAGRGGGRGGDPRQFGFSDADLALLRLTGGRGFDGTPDLPDLRGGDGEPEDRGDIQSLIEQLQTEQEVIEQFREEGLKLLAQANDKELELIGGREEAKLRLQQEYMDRLSALQDRQRQDTIRSTAGLFDALSSLARQGGSELFNISKGFAIAGALINTYEGITEALKLPPPLSYIEAARVGALGFAQVASIRNTRPGGGSFGGSGGVGAATNGGAAGESPGRTFVNVNLVGEGAIGRGQVRNLIRLINEEIEDGAVLGGIRVSGA